MFVGGLGYIATWAFGPKYGLPLAGLLSGFVCRFLSSLSCKGGLNYALRCRLAGFAPLKPPRITKMSKP